MAQPLLARLGGTIDVLAPPWVAPVVRRMPEVAEVIEAPLRHGALQLGERWRLARELRRRGYDRAVVLPNSWKSALIPFLARIPERVGYVGEMRHGLLNKTFPNQKQSMPAHYARLGGGSGQHQPLQVSPREIQDAKARFGIEGDYVVFCPGAEYGPAKRWPYFGELAAAVRDWAASLTSRIADAEREGALPADVISDLGELGVLGDEKLLEVLFELRAVAGLGVEQQLIGELEDPGVGDHRALGGAERGVGPRAWR